MRIELIASVLVLSLAMAGQAVADKQLCGETFASLDVLEAAIKAKPGVKVLESDPTVVSYSDPATTFIWNFATRANEAFPSVACRRLVEADGAFQVVTEISCGADKVVCDRLTESYNELDRRMREALRK